MNAPYVSQLDPVTGLGGNNCGPAGLAMLLAYRGVIAPTYGAMTYVADIVRDGIPDNVGRTGGYTTFAQLVRCAAWFDQPTVWIGSWADVHASLAADEPVILLVDNTALWPRQYPRSPAFDAHHFVVLTAYAPPAPGTSGDAASDRFVVNDPLSVYARGPAPYTAASLVAATTRVGGVQGIALTPLSQEQHMDGIIAELNTQVAALREEVAVRTGERDRAAAKADELVSTVAALREDVEKPLRAQVESLTGERDALVGQVRDLGTSTAERLADMHRQVEAAVQALNAAAGQARTVRGVWHLVEYDDGTREELPLLARAMPYPSEPIKAREGAASK